MFVMVVYACMCASEPHRSDGGGVGVDGRGGGRQAHYGRSALRDGPQGMHVHLYLLIEDLLLRVLLCLM